MTYYIGLYETNKAFGGPEEGGWWYDCGTLVKPLKKRFEDIIEAWDYVNKLQARVDRTLNKERYEPSSVLCDGWYKVEIHEGELPNYYPDVMPRYE